MRQVKAGMAATASQGPGLGNQWRQPDDRELFALTGRRSVDCASVLR